MPEAPLVTARNPYALAEAVLGRPVDWSAIEDRRAFVEDVLHTPYEQLFDPKHGSPIYLGFRLDADLRLTAAEPHGANGANGSGAESDLDRFPELDVREINTLADLGRIVGDDVAQLPVRVLTASRAGGYTIEVGEGPKQRTATLERIFSDTVIKRMIELRLIDTGWTPPGASWVDTGTFFKEAAEFFDPVQGALGDCWLIAAMSSVAWAMPYAIAERSRATGTPNEQFTNLFRFVDPATGVPVEFEATDETLVWSGSTSPLYGHSSEPGEIWPALVEKAFAMWRGNVTSDHPNLTVLNGGDPCWASAALTGRKPHYTGTAPSTAGDLINLVKANSVNNRTVNPMTAWTYPSGDASPDKVSYDDANLAASHAYSVLGWVHGTALARFARLEHWHVLSQDYIVLRNPWGYFEATTGNLSATVAMRDVSFWRSIDLDAVDGVFAIDAPTFKRYFAGIGVAT
jgi:hypothetical protein